PDVVLLHELASAHHGFVRSERVGARSHAIGHRRHVASHASFVRHAPPPEGWAVRSSCSRPRDSRTLADLLANAGSGARGRATPASTHGGTNVADFRGE